MKKSFLNRGPSFHPAWQAAKVLIVLARGPDNKNQDRRKCMFPGYVNYLRLLILKDTGFNEKKSVLTISVCYIWRMENTVSSWKPAINLRYIYKLS